jgi:hypothetical protein
MRGTPSVTSVWPSAKMPFDGPLLQRPRIRLDQGQRREGCCLDLRGCHLESADPGAPRPRPGDCTAGGETIADELVPSGMARRRSRSMSGCKAARPRSASLTTVPEFQNTTRSASSSHFSGRKDEPMAEPGWGSPWFGRLPDSMKAMPLGLPVLTGFPASALPSPHWVMHPWGSSFRWSFPKATKLVQGFGRSKSTVVGRVDLIGVVHTDSRKSNYFRNIRPAAVRQNYFSSAPSTRVQ